MADRQPAARSPIGATRVLLWLYAIFVVAAGSRSAVQLSTHPSRAPVAYTLSVVAAIVYAMGFVLLLRASRGGSARAAITWAWCELVAVLVVGTASLSAPDSFPDASVWSYYGAGYLFVPLVLPVFVVMRLRTRRPQPCSVSAS